MRIRPAQAEDAPAMADIAWAAKAFWNYPPEQLEAWRDALSPTAESIATQPTVVAELKGTPAGFYQLRLRATPPELEHLWVHPRHMGQGLGRALLAHALQHLTALGIDVLHIDADPHAEGFYQRFGAQRIDNIEAPIEGQSDRTRPQLILILSKLPGNAVKRTKQQRDGNHSPARQNPKAAQTPFFLNPPGRHP